MGPELPTAQLFFPEVMSFANKFDVAYKVGLMKPTGFFPANKRAELMRVIMPAMTGQDADVPETERMVPPMYTT